ncbi:hypothetical protein P171DRAFT_135222 [Karstenula rhodostoma CBS 690.94]|uniref:Uncharacterized protein n=1 Tax=Karstenula rhodostoma CBS 690.94 TaxID=1392251 RepID=A0A9P4PWE6_9PLEO|nr:hypothetical protein P171DRAFT_135222 [Karstenula rhodostoma CBS 690.94]
MFAAKLDMHLGVWDARRLTENGAVGASYAAGASTNETAGSTALFILRQAATTLGVCRCLECVRHSWVYTWETLAWLTRNGSLQPGVFVRWGT